MKPNVTSLERAFELAKSGRFRTTSEIKIRLRKEGYLSESVDGHTLLSHLSALIREARTASELNKTTPRVGA
jgi:hypothetical protein